MVRPVLRGDHPLPVQLYVDAETVGSTSGIGFVACVDGTVVAQQKRLLQHVGRGSKVEAAFRACLEAVRWAAAEGWRDITVLADVPSLLYALRGTSTPLTPEAATTAHAIEHTVKLNGLRVGYTWIPHWENMADHLARAALREAGIPVRQRSEVPPERKDVPRKSRRRWR